MIRLLLMLLAAAGSLGAPAIFAQGRPMQPVAERCLADFAVIKERLKSVSLPDYKDQFDTPPPQTAALISTLAADGSWPGINYDDKSAMTWAPHKHLENIWYLTSGYVRLAPAAPGRPAMKAAIDRALAFWFTRDPKSDNWWHNQIGVQLTLARIGLFLDDELTPEQRAGIVNILKRSNTGNQTGQNLVWTAGHMVVRGVLERSPDVCATAFDKIAGEIRVAPGKEEGIKADGSFHQHGQQLYNGGYGAGFAVDAARFLYYATNTAYEFPSEKTGILESFILDGSRWMVYRNICDYSARSREITRKGRLPDLSFLAAACRLLRESPGPRQQEVAAFCGELANRENRLTGNKHFWRSDYMSHRRPDWMLSVKMLSSRVQSGELVNGEGLRSHLLSDGVTYLYTGDGLAYFNIFPVWDWKRLPGITAEWSSAPPQRPVPSRGQSDFAGGVSNGTFGACSFIHQRGSLKARKSWFFFDRECVTLAAGIESGSEPAYTSLEQNLRAGDVTVSDGGIVRALDGELCSESMDWVHHRGVGYLFLKKGRVTARAAVQKGSWKDISASASADPVSAEVFSLYLDHGAGASGASYQCLVAPMDLTAFKAYAKNMPVRVLANTTDIAAVEHAGLGLIEAVFFREGTVAASDGTVISVEKPCLLLCRRRGTNLTISAANPFNLPLTLGITVNAELTGTAGALERSSGTTRILLKLPEGEFAGQTASASYTIAK